MKGFARGSLVRDSALAGLGGLLSNAGTYAFYAVTARALGPAAGGLFLALIAATLLVSMSANIAGVALTPDIARMNADGARGRIRSLAEALLRWWCLAAAVCLGVVVLSAPLGEGFFHLHGIAPLIAATAALCANALLLLVRAFLQGLGRFGDFARSNVVETLTKLAAALLIWVHPAIQIALDAFATALALSALASVWFVWRQVEFDRSEPYALHSRSGIIALLAMLSGLTALTFSDGIVARHSLSATDAGLYNAAALAGRALMAVLSFMPAVILAKLSRQRPDDSALGVRALVLAGAVCGCAVAFFAAFPAQILAAVGGAAYRSGAPLVALYGVAASALAMASIIATYRIGMGVRWLGWGLVAVAAAEITAMLLAPARAGDLVVVVVSGHTCAFLLSLVPLPARRRSRVAGEVPAHANAER